MDKFHEEINARIQIILRLASLAQDDVFCYSHAERTHFDSVAPSLSMTMLEGIVVIPPRADHLPFCVVRLFRVVRDPLLLLWFYSSPPTSRRRIQKKKNIGIAPDSRLRGNDALDVHPSSFIRFDVQIMRFLSTSEMFMASSSFRTGS